MGKKEFNYVFRAQGHTVEFNSSFELEDEELEQIKFFIADMLNVDDEDVRIVRRG